MLFRTFSLEFIISYKLVSFKSRKARNSRRSHFYTQITSLMWKVAIRRSISSQSKQHDLPDLLMVLLLICMYCSQTKNTIIIINDYLKDVYMSILYTHI